MTKLTELMRSLSHYADTQRALSQCRQRAIGDVDYYSYSYALSFKQAEQHLEHTLNTYIDERVAEQLKRYQSPLVSDVPEAAIRSSL